MLGSLVAFVGLTNFASIEPVWKLEAGLVVSSVSRGGRLPIPNDGVLASILSGNFKAPVVGAKVLGADKREHPWVVLKAEKDGFLRGDELDNGYVYATYESPTDQVLVLTATSDSLVYVNGVPHAGDPYGYGYLSFPVHLKAGVNELLFNCGRGQLAARLEKPRALAQFGGSDWTLPDVIPADKSNLTGAVPVVNNSPSTLSGYKIRASIDGQTVETPVPPILAYSFRKVPFSFGLPKSRKAGNAEYSLAVLNDQGAVLDETKVGVRIVDGLQPYKRTFLSQIDGSLQYFAVTPSQKPGPSDALVLTLHGASVEALGQAQAYSSKDWCTIVAATNRRPYGFDWEKWGRRDALEVLDIAKSTFPHDPSRVSLTGHSMGGHGTWSIGSLYPDVFASVNPSAGWISFSTYAGGYRPTNPTPIDRTFLTANDGSDTLARKTNLLEQKVFILHGDKDDNVPVTEARTMKRELEALGEKVGYHEEPGAGHWWGGRCVDYPDLFENIREAKLLPSDDPAPVSFVTPNPGISSHDRYLKIWQTLEPGVSSGEFHVEGNVLVGTTQNVESLELGPIKASLKMARVDGQEIPWDGKDKLRLKRVGLTWTEPKSWDANEKSPARSGPLEAAFQRRFALVYGTQSGSGEVNLALARYLSETWSYRGNGAVDVLSDREFAALRGLPGRNVVLIGNADTNLAWRGTLRGCPIVANNRELRVGASKYDASGKAALFLYPRSGDASGLVAALTLSDWTGVQALARLPIFGSGTDFPDWTVLDTAKAGSGTAGVLAAGFFDNRWQVTQK